MQRGGKNPKRLCRVNLYSTENVVILGAVSLKSGAFSPIFFSGQRPEELSKNARLRHLDKNRVVPGRHGGLYPGSRATIAVSEMAFGAAAQGPRVEISMERGTERILVHIDKDLEEIVPGYVQNRWRDVEAMRLAVANKDMESLRVMGHRMKGSGAGYGFDAITEIGRKLESAARDGQIEEITREIDALVAYLQRVDICYD